MALSQIYPCSHSNLKISIQILDLSLKVLVSGLNVRVLSVDNDELGKVTLPCILHWDCDHFVV
ncbi:cysteine peptidase family C39 domain-containing protein [Escherichia coli]|uniref:cysteine peptidase family C39 domain-containing protein n=1 Tax=Escherichia coli TaxID=562 RepID=UPI001FCEDEAF|nr:cysteine peptidase family C39 domain-containing protein [Escherichia coli]